MSKVQEYLKNLGFSLEGSPGISYYSYRAKNYFVLVYPYNDSEIIDNNSIQVVVTNDNFNDFQKDIVVDFGDDNLKVLSFIIPELIKNY